MESNVLVNVPWKGEHSHKEEDSLCMSYALYSNETTEASPVEIFLKKQFGNAHLKPAQQYWVLCRGSNHLEARPGVTQVRIHHVGRRPWAL